MSIETTTALFSKLPQPDESVDLLDRARLLDSFTQVVASLAQPTVISVEAPWGAGKTHFMKQAAKKLADKDGHGLTVVRVDAWSTDFAKTPFYALFGEIDAVMQAEPKTSALWAEKAKVASLVLARHIGYGLFKKFTGIDIEDAKDALEAASERAADIKDQDDLLGEFKSYKASRQSLIDLLTEAISKLPHARLVVMVDELDRCRPNYAVELLEDIKHLFFVPGLTFVLAVDPTSLKTSVAHVFGIHDARAQIYLQKFIDVPFKLPVVTSTQFVEKMYDDLGLESVHNYLVNPKAVRATTIDFFRVYAEKFSLGLREQQHAFSLVGLCLKILAATPKEPESRWYSNVELTVFLCLLRISSPDAFDAYRKERSAEAVLRVLKGTHPELREFLDEDTDAATIIRSLLIMGAGRQEVIEKYLNKNTVFSGFPGAQRIAELVRYMRDADVMRKSNETGAAQRIMDTIWYFGWDPKAPTAIK